MRSESWNRLQGDTKAHRGENLHAPGVISVIGKFSRDRLYGALHWPSRGILTGEIFMRIKYAPPLRLALTRIPRSADQFAWSGACAFLARPSEPLQEPSVSLRMYRYS